MSDHGRIHTIAIVALYLLLASAFVFLVGTSHAPGQSPLPLAGPLLISPPILTWLVSVCLLVAGPGVVVRILAAFSLVIPLVLIAIYFVHHRPGERDGLLYLQASLWAVIISYACVLLASIAAIIRTSGYGLGRCSECGYNLTGNISGVCPECGTPMPKRAADAAEAVPPMEKSEQD